ncbi:MAG: hypothetical protein UV64_C0007G0041 [Parcubacteria group bacterium GW2011_GWC1_43_11b]|nr:MAG: hypothetical protein UV64_C0007G0041 [Parcubacteria group bacterium GW2011_GWC1_43_11b]
MKASEVRKVTLLNGKTRYCVFTTPEEVQKELESQGPYPEICLSIDVEE